MHQKQPPPKVAMAFVAGLAAGACAPAWPGADNARVSSIANAQCRFIVFSTTCPLILVRAGSAIPVLLSPFGPARLAPGPMYAPLWRAATQLDERRELPVAHGDQHAHRRALGKR